MGQSKVARSRPFLPIVLALLTVVAIGIPMFPLLGAAYFRAGGKTTDRTGTATIISCDTIYYGMVHTCEAMVVWPRPYTPAPEPVREVVWANHSLSGEVKVEERSGSRRNSDEVVPADHPQGSTGAVWLEILLLAVIVGPGVIVCWQAGKRLRKPLPEAPPENADLRSAQVTRDKARRRRRKNNR